MDIHKLYNAFQEHPAVCTDSRKAVKGAIFFALKGDSFDGNHFAEEALTRGCSIAVIDNPAFGSDDRYVLVDNVLDTLQELATCHRNKLKINVLAITGSNGKTTTKELCYGILSQKFNTIATQGNLNNHIGVPLTILSITGDTEVAVIEMGANHPGEITTLCQIARPGLGIITNIGKAHLEGFGSYGGVIRAKKELYDFIREKGGTLFVNADNDLLMTLSESVHRLTYGSGNAAMVMGGYAFMDPFLHLRISISSTGSEYAISTRLTGQYNLENVLAAFTVGRFFDIDPNAIVAAIESYQPKNMRSQVLDTQHNRLILDAYNANPSSMEAAIMNFTVFPGTNKWLILGDMLELGSSSLTEHQRILDLALQLHFDQGLLIGERFMEITKPEGFRKFQHVSDARQYLRQHPIRKSTILIKGSRAIGLEKLMDLL